MFDGPCWGNWSSAHDMMMRRTDEEWSRNAKSTVTGMRVPQSILSIHKNIINNIDSNTRVDRNIDILIHKKVIKLMARLVED